MSYDIRGMRDEAVPRYYRIELDLRERLQQGAFRDTGFPTDEALCKQYDVSRMTIRHALQGLENDGLIERHRGKRTVIRNKAVLRLHRHPGRLILGLDRDLRMQGAEPKWKVIRTRELRTDKARAEELDITAGALCTEVERVGKIENEPVWLERHLMPVDVGRTLKRAEIAHGVLAYAIDRSAGPIADVLLRIHGEAADAPSAAALNVALGFNLLVCDYTLRSAKKRTLDRLRLTFRTDRLELNFAFKNQPQTESVLGAALLSERRT